MSDNVHTKLAAWLQEQHERLELETPDSHYVRGEAAAYSYAETWLKTHEAEPLTSLSLDCRVKASDVGDMGNRIENEWQMRDYIHGKAYALIRIAEWIEYTLKRAPEPEQVTRACVLCGEAVEIAPQAYTLANGKTYVSCGKHDERLFFAVAKAVDAGKPLPSLEDVKRRDLIEHAQRALSLSPVHVSDHTRFALALDVLRGLQMPVQWIKYSSGVYRQAARFTDDGTLSEHAVMTWRDRGDTEEEPYKISAETRKTVEEVFTAFGFGVEWIAFTASRIYLPGTYQPVQKAPASQEEQVQA